MESSRRHTCLKLEVQLDAERPAKEAIFVKGSWSDSRFDLDITDGLHAWTCHASEGEVRQRAEQWDQPVTEYVALAERYLGFQQRGSRYAFEDAGDGQRRCSFHWDPSVHVHPPRLLAAIQLSWTFERQGTKLEWRWKCQPSSNDKQTTAAILDFLMDANIRLSEEVVRKTQSFEKIKVEAEKCLSQSEKLNKEKAEFESAVYSKFVAVLNSKKAKLRELRDKISKLESAGPAPQEENESTDPAESFDEGSNDDKIMEEAVEESAIHDSGVSENVAMSSMKQRQKKARK